MTKQEEKIIENLKNRSQAEARITLRFIEKLQKDNYKLDRENQHYFDRIQDLQKENEKLKDRIEYLGNEKYALYQDNISLLKEKYGAESLNYKYIEMAPVEAKGYISEDKIRNKIKELEEELDDDMFRYETMAAIDILEELLGE